MPEPEGSIEVVSSESGGNGLPVETPSEVATTETPTEKVETEQPAESAQELFELPDGRKVDGETLAKEWKENFLPEFTRKSQTLAEIEKGKLKDNEPAKNPYADPAYVPQSYEEVIKVAEERALKTIEQREQARVEQHQAIENEVVNQLTDIKKTDPTLNENALFLHANKYGFKDLKVAHQNMKDMAALAKNVQTTTAKNIAKRNDPVSISPGATGAKPNPANFSSAIDYLRSVKEK